jgi:large subunit ribosomal protein L13
MNTKTTHPKLAEVKQDEHWYILDAEGKVLGQIATKLATMLRGKHKPNWHPSINSGDHVVVINAEKVVLTGNKEMKKEYIHHTQFPGGIKRMKAGKMRAEKPERMIELAVTGMIPRNRIRQHALAKLHVYAGTEHPHGGQNPKTLILGEAESAPKK